MQKKPLPVVRMTFSKLIVLGTSCHTDEVGPPDDLLRTVFRCTKSSGAG